MTTKPTTGTTTSAAEQAIATNIAAIEELLRTAHAQAAEAVEYMGQGNRNAAIGTILGLEQLLVDAQALQAAAIALHRHALGMPPA